MKQQSEDETVLRLYLLGALTQEERSRIEERLFLSNDYFQLLQAAEDELIDDYIYEELTLDDRDRFETHFLSAPGRREDLKIARALREYISQEVEPDSPPLASVSVNPSQPSETSKVVSFPFWRNLSTFARVSLAAAALIVFAIGIWQVIKAMRHQEQSRPMQAQQPVPQPTATAKQQQEQTTTVNQPGQGPLVEQEQHAERRGQGKGAEKKEVATRTGRETTAPPMPPLKDQASSGITLTVLLIPGSGVRGGGEINNVPLSSDVRFVTLQLPLVGTNTYSSYRVTLRTNANTIRTWKGLKSVVIEGAGNGVAVQMPAKLLRLAKYQLKLDGVTREAETVDIASYTFQVVKK